ncbi:MAG: hypothetical protein ACLGI6_10830 [Gammaproteobacteria bacterium]
MSHDHARRVARPAGAAHPRTDFRTRDVVNQAIAAVPTLGVQQVAEFLSSMNVPPEVAIRALAPQRRKG